MQQLPEKYKHPRTPHLPWSESRTRDDLAWCSIDALINKDVVVTEKLDGECTSIYTDGSFHARSLSGRYHPSQWPIRQLASVLGPLLPEGCRIVGENCYAKHSIAYCHLPAWFLVFAIVDESNLCLSWEETKANVFQWQNQLGRTHLALVPELFAGLWDEVRVRSLFTGHSQFGGQQEGYVVRIAEHYPYAAWADFVAKYVRPNHVQSGDNRRQQTVTPNGLT